MSESVVRVVVRGKTKHEHPKRARTHTIGKIAAAQPDLVYSPSNGTILPCRSLCPDLVVLVPGFLSVK